MVITAEIVFLHEIIVVIWINIKLLSWEFVVSIYLQVHKIFGPGNQFVTAAKMILQNSEAMVSIDMPAGPSEVLVIADQR